MSPVRLARTPAGVLYRIGHLPDPLAWPPLEGAGGSRFDDPQRAFRVLYATARRRAAFVETLAQFRQSVDALARFREMEAAPEAISSGRVPAGWRQRRGVARLRLRPGQRWLDLRVAETHEELRRELAPTLLELGFKDLDLSGLLGPSRPLTQGIARWAYDRGHAGLVYSSRLDAKLACWAIFEGAAFTAAGDAELIAPDDPDLVATAQLFGLIV